MDVSDAIKQRRAFRSLAPFRITKDLIYDLAGHARLSPSCFNNQPWRFVFVSDRDQLDRIHEALSRTNQWAKRASCIIAVFSREEDDCVIRDRLYHQFDCGMAVGFLMLRATELGLVAHPIAGFSPKKTREILDIPEEYKIITLIIVGRKAEILNPELTEEQKKIEARRPSRLKFDRFLFLDSFRGDSDKKSEA